MREMGRGNWSRVPGSLSILLSQMGILNSLFRDSSQAANIVAEAYGKLASQAAVAAVAATQKAAASAAAFTADEANTEATLAQAVADEEAAVAARANAAAMVQKAESASSAASAEMANAAATTASVGPLGIVAGIVIALGVGIYAAYKLSGALVERLSGLKFPDFHPEYIAKHLQGANQVAEGWKKINHEVERAVDGYYSVAKAAERVADATKAQFEHERKMNEYAKERDMARAKTPAAKAAVEKEYSQKEIDIANRERQAEINNKAREAFNLQREGERKKAQADAVNVPSKEHDQNVLGNAKQQAEAAQKYLDEMQDARTNGKPFSEKVVRAYNSVALSGVSGSDLDAAQKTNEAEARRRISAYHDTVDSVATNDEKRKKKEELTKDAGESFSKAGVISASLPDLKAKAAQAAKDAQEEAAAKAEAEQDKLNDQKATVMHGSVNSLQQVGAYTSPAQVSLIDIHRKQLGKLDSIDKKLGHGHHGKGQLGGVKYG